MYYMFSQQRQITNKFFQCLLFPFLIVGLVACNSTGNAPANLSTTPSLAQTPTSAPITTLKTYTGTSFSLSYPQDWKVQGTGNQVIFQDAQGLNALTVIITPNPKGTKSANALADTTFPLVEKAILTNAQTTQVISTVSVGGETWVQRGATGTLNTGGQSVPGKLIMLVDNHPAQTSATLAYEIYYGGPTATFDQKENALFQAMLQSFTF